jgi:putative ABC transport system permease protein
MNLFKLSWKNLISKPLSMGLSLVLVALGVSLTSILFLINKQFKDRLYNNIEGINMVVGAKGSPLQMILSSVYHIDVPTGNIPLKKIKWLKKNQFVEQAIPLALGDSYEGFRIVGTEQSLAEHYEAELSEGKLWEKDMEATVGAKVAAKLNLKIGDTFYGAHGLVNDNMHVHETHAYKVVGLLKQSNTVLDQLILTNVASVWRVHEEHDHGEDEHDHDHEGDDHGHNHDADEHKHNDHGHDHDHGDDGHSHDNHGHDHDHGHSHEAKEELAPISEEGKEVTAVLVRYAKDKQGKTSAMAATMLPKFIDETEGLEELGYAIPAYELQRLMENMGLGAQFLYVLALIIIIISAFSMFISLYNSMKERKYEIALMRTMGASRLQLFFMVALEGLLIALFGALLGLLISHGGMGILSGYLESTYQYSFSALTFLTAELYLFVGALGIGFVAALAPALQAYSTDISTTLSN